ncbi:hypothetical protein TRAPUB_8414 [Trametes pubescens]|uniref:Uncharacterized protein n=1 Tax=Trametes pubescens TaxID=154538 RepID=A0A1M2W540_TRAPU|nr:hypothetical protein TRAPUB_8414 [Trametes pubescens]
MFSRFLNVFSSSQSAPSALILVRIPGGRADAVLHIVPEDGTIETFSVTESSPSNRTTFRQYGAVEQSREELGTVVLLALPHEWDLGFLDDVRARAQKIMESLSIFSSAKKEQAGSVDVSLLVEEILKPAALDAIHALEGRALPENAAVETYHVSIVYVNRSKPGHICGGEPRSIM